MKKGPGLLRRHLLRRTLPAKNCQSASYNINMYTRYRLNSKLVQLAELLATYTINFRITNVLFIQLDCQ